MFLVVGPNEPWIPLMPQETDLGSELRWVTLGAELSLLSWSEKSESVNCSVVFNSLQVDGLYLPGSSAHGILQERIPEWVAITFSRGSSQSRGWTQVSCVADTFFYHLSHQGSPLTVLLSSKALGLPRGGPQRRKGSWIRLGSVIRVMEALGHNCFEPSTILKADGKLCYWAYCRDQITLFFQVNKIRTKIVQWA